jgi:hypothetical protein
LNEGTTTETAATFSVSGARGMPAGAFSIRSLY